MKKFEHAFSCVTCPLDLDLDFYHLNFVSFHFHTFVLSHNDSYF